MQIAGKLGAGNALSVRRDQPDRGQPLSKRDFAVLEDRPDPDRKAPPAPGALKDQSTLEMIDRLMPAIGAELPKLPSDRREILYRRRLIRNSL